MRIVKKGGVTPCDRRLDRRKVAIAAAAALLLFATPVQAATYVINSALSSITLKLTLQSPDTGGLPLVFGDIDPTKAPYNAAPFAALIATHPAISNKATAFGTIDATISPGTKIDFGMTSSVGYALNGGVYFGGPPFPGPFGAPFATPMPGQIGWAGNIGPSTAALGVIAGMSQTFGPGASATYSGGFNYPFPVDPVGNVLLATGGTANINILLSGGSLASIYLPEAFDDGTTANVPDAGDVPLFSPLFDIPFPIPVDSETTLYGPTSPVALPVTWDGTVLTVPLNSYLRIDTIDEDTSALTRYIVEVSGQLVTVAIPEPSTMLLFGFGIAGLLSYAWRKRRAAA